MNKSKVIVIVGPTASGKTALSIELAKEINGEIISADSMQIYKDMNIGTAKPTSEEMQNIKHHLIDIIEPSEKFSVAEYKKMAEAKIEKILSKGKTPIIVGGTGLYITSLIENVKFEEIEIDSKYREELIERANSEGLDKLYDELKVIDPASAERISKNDLKRITRALEVYNATGKTITEHNLNSKLEEVKYDYYIFGLNSEDREIIYDRINKRVDLMMNQGLIEEVENLINKYKEFPTAMQGLGYKEVKEYLDGFLSIEEMIEKLKLQTRHYAKRQLTWFRRYKQIIWLDIMDTMENKLEIIKKSINME